MRKSVNSDFKLTYSITKKTVLKKSLNNKLIFSVLIVFALSIFLIQNSYAQTPIEIDEQVVLSDNLLTDPVAQDILKKIEQTKKIIAELEQKEFENNQAKENLEKMRQMSIERLNQDLEEWERLWEKHSSRNSFESFVSKKPEYVQGVFWDQFEFKEEKVKAGRNAMYNVLTNGGTFYEAKEAYNKAAATKKIELIEMNAQFNVKHNLAYFDQQQLFNSTGQFHPSPAAEQSIFQYFKDYRLDPTYLLANPNDDYSATHASQDGTVECRDEYALVHRTNQNDYVCIQESTAQMWERHEMGTIVEKKDIQLDENSMVQNVPTNPGTKCKDDHVVLYDVLESQYSCVLDTTAKQRVADGTGEIHDLYDYILNKDKYKIVIDKIYDINQEIKQVTETYDSHKKALEKQYDANLEYEDQLTREKMQEIVEVYSNNDVTKEDVSKQISELRELNDSIKEKILEEKSDALSGIEINLKKDLLKIIKGYENHPDINVDWDYLFGKSSNDDSVEYKQESKNDPITNISFSKKSIDKIKVENMSIVNSFGQKFDEIKTDQIIQIATDITNNNEEQYDFVYMVKIKSANGNESLVQPTKWLTGTLNSEQTLNVGLSWIPDTSGEFIASLFIGPDMDSVVQIADMEIKVDSEMDVFAENYCKEGYELLFKYSDNSPICVTTENTAKLINIGLAFD